VVLTAAAGAQSAAQSTATWCGDQSSDRASYCEVREETIPAVNPLEVDARPNGGIRVRGWDGNEAVVRSRIVGYGDTEAEARRIVSGIRIVTAGGSIHAEGADRSRGEEWHVSFELQVPRAAMLTLNTTNGGIMVDDFRGTATIHVKNGGVTLRSVGGDIHGETTNGGVNVDLDGDRWDGTGLDVQTHNGGIRITMPKDYSAALEVGTTRGRVSIDFPVTVQGTIGRHLETVLGSGGARIRAITTNGGVTIRQK
jgi:DUF4097 and DUF4098 domain-containing protein YvlB